MQHVIEPVRLVPGGQGDVGGVDLVPVDALAGLVQETGVAMGVVGCGVAFVVAAGRGVIGVCLVKFIALVVRQALEPARRFEMPIEFQRLLQVGHGGTGLARHQIRFGAVAICLPRFAFLVLGLLIVLDRHARQLDRQAKLARVNRAQGRVVQCRVDHTGLLLRKQRGGLAVHAQRLLPRALAQQRVRHAEPGFVVGRRDRGRFFMQQIGVPMVVRRHRRLRGLVKGIAGDVVAILVNGPAALQCGDDGRAMPGIIVRPIAQDVGDESLVEHMHRIVPREHRIGQVELGAVVAATQNENDRAGIERELVDPVKPGEQELRVEAQFGRAAHGAIVFRKQPGGFGHDTAADRVALHGVEPDRVHIQVAADKAHLAERVAPSQVAAAIVDMQVAVDDDAAPGLALGRLQHLLADADIAGNQQPRRTAVVPECLVVLIVLVLVGIVEAALSNARAGKAFAKTGAREAREAVPCRQVSEVHCHGSLKSGRCEGARDGKNIIITLTSLSSRSPPLPAHSPPSLHAVTLSIPQSITRSHQWPSPQKC